MPALGIEPSSSALQADALTLRAKPAVMKVGEGRESNSLETGSRPADSPFVFNRHEGVAASALEQTKMASAEA